ncbi:MAG: excalibur calcium-binding domain-containing protein [Ilumatobacter sp.]|uniref:excalibur calcium-binding domain-containing protein n=1 Tax=Ilumatobacter sp. TaxID=1967498 RepID=UPI003297BE17
MRTFGRCVILGGVLLVSAACEEPADSTASTNSTEAVAASAVPVPEDTAITTVPAAPLALVDDCVQQTMGRAFNGEEFWQEHWNNMNQDEARLRDWCDQYGNDDPEALAELSRQWQLSLAEVESSTTAAPVSIVPFVDPVVASTAPATIATTTTTTNAPPPPPPPPPPPAPANVSYQNCDAVRAAGADPIYRGDPGYESKLDRDGDGVGCE